MIAEIPNKVYHQPPLVALLCSSPYYSLLHCTLRFSTVEVKSSRAAGTLVGLEFEDCRNSFTQRVLGQKFKRIGFVKDRYLYVFQSRIA